MNFFLNLTISRSIINLYGLQVSMSLKTYKAIKLGIECTNFFSLLSLQMSVLIIHGYCFQVSYARSQLKQKKSFALNKTLDCFPKNFPNTQGMQK